MSRIYTDGSCRLGVGGWAWWNEDTGEERSGYVLETTNQRMELKAALEALNDHMDDDQVTIVSDSAYLVNCFGQDWWVRWQRNNWLTSKNVAVSNRDIWEPLLDLVQEHGNVQFEWVKGHSGVYGNERVDALAQKEVAEQRPHLVKSAGAVPTMRITASDQENGTDVVDVIKNEAGAKRTISALERNKRRRAINEEKRVKNGEAGKK